MYNIHGLYYFSRMENLNSIIINGILPKNVVEKRGLNFEVFANQEVQKRRHWKMFNLKSNNQNNNPRPIRLHSLVQLYFTPKTPTLSAVRELQDNIFFTQIDPEIICNENISYCFTDGNAAISSTKHYTDLDDLDRISWDVIHAEYWNSFQDGKRIRNSEVLIHPNVSTDFFKKIVVSNQNNLEIVNTAFQTNNIKLICEVNSKYFF